MTPYETTESETPLSLSPEDHSHLITMIGELPLTHDGKQQLETAANDAITLQDHLEIIDACIEAEQATPQTVLELLEYRREVMLIVGAPDDEVAAIVIKIQEAAFEIFMTSRKPKPPAVAATLAPKNTVGRRRRILQRS